MQYKITPLIFIAEPHPGLIQRYIFCKDVISVGVFGVGRARLFCFRPILLLAEMFLQYVCFGFAYDGCPFLRRGFAESFYAFEFFEQGIFALFTDAFYLVQFRGGLPLAALVTMEGDGIAVYFILYAGQQVE